MMKGERSVQANLLVFTQFNANSVDHNTTTVAGEGTFHGLDMISDDDDDEQHDCKVLSHTTVLSECKVP